MESNWRWNVFALGFQFTDYDLVARVVANPNAAYARRKLANGTQDVSLFFGPFVGNLVPFSTGNFPSTWRPWQLLSPVEPD